MKNLLLVMAFSAIYIVGNSQNLNYNDLRTILDYKDFQIDTFLVKRQYIASPKEQEDDTYYFRWTHRLDSAGKSYYQYVSVVDVYQKNVRSRMLRYGTLDKMEMADILDELIENGYVYKEQFQFGSQIHIYYVKGSDKVVVKHITIEAPTRKNTLYEFEFGS